MKITKKFKIEDYERVSREAELSRMALNQVLNGTISAPIHVIRNDEEFFFRFWENTTSGFTYFTCTFRYKPSGQKDSTSVYCLDEIEHLHVDSVWNSVVREARYKWNEVRQAEPWYRQSALKTA